MQILVIPFSRSFDEFGFTYLVPKELEQDILVGQIVEIPFGEKQILGAIGKILTDKQSEQSIETIKYISKIRFPHSLIGGYKSELLFFISQHYFTPIHNSLSLFFPKNTQEKLRKNTLTLKKARNFSYEEKYSLFLSERQKEVFCAIKNSQNTKHYLHGITGSGKTEIYIKLIESYIEKGQQSLLLIPEIILSNQIANRLETYFGKDILVLNSSVSEAKKTQIFLDIYSGNAKIILGTRSALFYPYKNLGLIIMDEEHDNSYISDKAPRYNSKVILEKITELNGNKLLLASGTPSINAMYKAQKKEYELHTLLEKYKKIN